MKKAILVVLAFTLLFGLSSCGMEQQKIVVNYGETSSIELSKQYSELVWESADSAIAAVKDGKIMGLLPGSTTITGSSKGKPVVELSVEVNLIEITGIFLNQSSLILEQDEAVQLKYSLVPDNASDYGIKWKSVNEDVATVEEDGTVHAKGVGTTTIICSSKSGAMGTCEVTVKPPSAIELLNDVERGIFEYMTQTMLSSFYNASAVRIRNIYGAESIADSIWTLDIQGTNKLGGTVFKQYTIMKNNGKYSYFDVSDIFNQSKATPLDKSFVDYSKLNAALEEYWANSSIK